MRIEISLNVAFFNTSITVMAEQTEYNMVLTWLFICGFFRGLYEI